MVAVVLDTLGHELVVSELGSSRGSVLAEIQWRNDVRRTLQFCKLNAREVCLKVHSNCSKLRNQPNDRKQDVFERSSPLKSDSPPSVFAGKVSKLKSGQFDFKADFD